MGTDIHAHIEIKLNGQNKWEHWQAPKIARNYLLFGRLSGVRCEDQEHPPVRGLPEDISVCTKLEWDKMGSDAHSPSWITWHEFLVIKDWVERQEHYCYSGAGHGWHNTIGYLLGNDYVPTEEVEDIRMVF